MAEFDQTVTGVCMCVCEGERDGKRKQKVEREKWREVVRAIRTCRHKKERRYGKSYIDSIL